MLTCRWCAETYDETDSLDCNDTGFWCDICDCFTFYHPSEQTKHRLLLLLEQKGSGSAPQQVIPSVQKLRKRLSPLRYPGGKSKLIDYLYTKLSAENLETFVEFLPVVPPWGSLFLMPALFNALCSMIRTPVFMLFGRLSWNLPKNF